MPPWIYTVLGRRWFRIDEKKRRLWKSKPPLHGRVNVSALRRLFFFCRRAADYSIFMKLGASQIYGEKNQRQFPKRSMPLGLPISHTAYRCSFVPPIEAKQPEHGRQEEARPIGTMDLFPGSAAKPGTEKLPLPQPKLQSDFYWLQI